MNGAFMRKICFFSCIYLMFFEIISNQSSLDMLELSKKELMEKQNCLKSLDRNISSLLLEAAKKVPIVTVLGSFQSGKTTLTRTIFTKHRYLSLKNYETREFASTNPKNFLKFYENEHGVILDEIHYAPKLFSYIQNLVQGKFKPGYFILISSQDFLNSELCKLTIESSAKEFFQEGVSVFTLLPLSINELNKNSLSLEEIDNLAFKGTYPNIHTDHLNSITYYNDYLDNYMWEIVKKITNINDLMLFVKFMRICANNMSQMLNLTFLANESGIDVRTAKKWLKILEASFIIFLLPAYSINSKKRSVRSPKLYFYDTGLACALLGMDSINQLSKYHQRGAIIETFIISNIIKHYYNNGIKPRHVYFWRDKSGHEIDCLIQKVNDLIPVEIKSSLTITSDFFDGLRYWQDITKNIYPKGYIVYGGSRDYERSEGRIVSWKNMEEIFK